MEGNQMRKVNYTRHIGLVISEETYRKLVKITNEKEIPLSQFVRDILEERLDRAQEETVQ
jgi:predicted CopG family antitoxin